MLVYRFEKLCGVGQMVEHIGRDDQVEEASQVHRLRVRDDGVIPASLHLATWSGTMSMPTHDRATDASRAWEVRSRPTSNSPLRSRRRGPLCRVRAPRCGQTCREREAGRQLFAAPSLLRAEYRTGASRTCLPPNSLVDFEDPVADPRPTEIDWQVDGLSLAAHPDNF